jgi:hypothetical protein
MRVNPFTDFNLRRIAVAVRKGNACELTAGDLFMNSM